MHELESFLHLLQRLGYFDEAFLYPDEVGDFHGVHHLQGPLVKVEGLKICPHFIKGKDTCSI